MIFRFILRENSNRIIQLNMNFRGESKEYMK